MKSGSLFELPDFFFIQEGQHGFLQQIRICLDTLEMHLSHEY